MDYNEQALFSGVYSINHPELAGPYYDFIAAQLAGGGPASESAAMGCPGGVHFSVDLVNWYVLCQTFVESFCLLGEFR